MPHDAPAADFTGDSVTVTATSSAGRITYTANKANAESVKTELLLQPLRSAGRLPVEDGYRSKQFVAFATGSLSVTIEVPAGSYAPAYRFVNPRTGQEIALVALPVVRVV